MMLMRMKQQAIRLISPMPEPPTIPKRSLGAHGENGVVLLRQEIVCPEVDRN